ncbi:MAG: polyprenyl synthetase family protein [Deltaproteobacteria bacterium]|nr:polyprenyl synthetase family protein [Deltaproteobacteria bacterium]
MKNAATFKTLEARTSRNKNNGPADLVDTRNSQRGADRWLPRSDQLDDLLELNFGGAIEEVLDSALLNPVREIAFNPGKKIRAKLVELSRHLVNEDDGSSLSRDHRAALCSEVVEFIHMGSLVVDDIEDGSKMRRGKPALHMRQGLPIALNAGNWLYFWPLKLLKSAGFPQDALLLAYEHCHQSLLRAHFGQAVDLGARIDAIAQERVPQVCLAAMELKTGALMGFATLLGGLLGGADRRALSILRQFGEGLGVALQMFDDLGNVTSKREPTKRFEDLMLYRPSWVWAVAAELGSSADYRSFISAAHKLPDERQLEKWLADHYLLKRGCQSAEEFMAKVFAKLNRRLSDSMSRPLNHAFEELRELGAEIARAYE